MGLEGKLVVFLDEVGISDIGYVGGKNASLGEMIRHLKSKGVNVPYGFVVTAEAYRYFVKHNNLEQKIKDTLKDLDPSNLEQLAKKGTCCKRDDKGWRISKRLGR
jgi:Phosphoenolpyruvate synthase/pyruvate phosphate dikinase